MPCQLIRAFDRLPLGPANECRSITLSPAAKWMALVSRLVVTADRLAERRAHYFMDQQIGLHGTIVSIALGVAGLPPPACSRFGH